jgi:glyoxylate/hydroxypyruvate reductase A
MTRTILFYSPRSDPRWPAMIEAALPGCRVITDPAAAPAEEVEAAVVFQLPPGGLHRFANLRLVQCLGAGTDQILDDPGLPSKVPVARLLDDGLATLVADYVLLHSLALHRELPAHRAAQTARRWDYRVPRPVADCRVAVLGLGAIGTTCLERLRGAGFDAIGWSASARPSLGAVAWHGENSLESVLSGADVVVLVLPLTPKTRGLVDDRFLRAMKPGAGLINVGRGGLIDEAALLRGLDDGRPGHAVLDVFAVEPLPADHPFWDHPSVTVTPHCAGATRPDAAVQAVAANLRKVLDGSLPLGLVDRSRGY